MPLEELDLSNNKLSSLPYELTKQKNLLRLLVNHNSITSLEFEPNPEEMKIDMGEGEEEEKDDLLQHLLDLQTLDLSHNKIQNLPHGISRLRNLQKLYLDHNLFTSLPKPAQLRPLQNLKELNLRCNLVETSPELEESLGALDALPRLGVLDLGDNEATLTQLIQMAENADLEALESLLRGEPLPLSYRASPRRSPRGSQNRRGSTLKELKMEKQTYIKSEAMMKMSCLFLIRRTDQQDVVTVKKPEPCFKSITKQDACVVVPADSTKVFIWLGSNASRRVKEKAKDFGKNISLEIKQDFVILDSAKKEDDILYPNGLSFWDALGGKGPLEDKAPIVEDTQSANILLNLGEAEMGELRLVFNEHPHSKKLLGPSQVCVLDASKHLNLVYCWIGEGATKNKKHWGYFKAHELANRSGSTVIFLKEGKETYLFKYQFEDWLDHSEWEEAFNANASDKLKAWIKAGLSGDTLAPPSLSRTSSGGSNILGKPDLVFEEHELYVASSIAQTFAGQLTVEGVKQSTDKQKLFKVHIDSEQHMTFQYQPNTKLSALLKKLAIKRGIKEDEWEFVLGTPGEESAESLMLDVDMSMLKDPEVTLRRKEALQETGSTPAKSKNKKKFLPLPRIKRGQKAVPQINVEKAKANNSALNPPSWRENAIDAILVERNLGIVRSQLLAISFPSKKGKCSLPATGSIEYSLDTIKLNGVLLSFDHASIVWSSKEHCIIKSSKISGGLAPFSWSVQKNTFPKVNEKGTATGSFSDSRVTLKLKVVHNKESNTINQLSVVSCLVKLNNIVSTPSGKTGVIIDKLVRLVPSLITNDLEEFISNTIEAAINEEKDRILMALNVSLCKKKTHKAGEEALLKSFAPSHSRSKSIGTFSKKKSQ